MKDEINKTCNFKPDKISREILAVINRERNLHTGTLKLSENSEMQFTTKRHIGT